MRVPIRVRPGAGRTAVGGSHDGALVTGVTSRTKVVDVEGGDPDRLRDLLSR